MKRFLPLIVLVAAVIAGCATRPLDGGAGVQPAPPGTDLIELGETLIWFGGIIGVVALGLRCAVAFATASPLLLILSAFSTIYEIVAELGAVALLSGVCLIYLGAHLWLLWLAIGLAIVAWIVHRWPDLRQWLGIGPHPVPPVEVVSPNPPSIQLKG